MRAGRLQPLHGVDGVVTMVPTKRNGWAPMQPNSQKCVHGAEVNTQVLAECGGRGTVAPYKAQAPHSKTLAPVATVVRADRT